MAHSARRFFPVADIYSYPDVDCLVDPNILLRLFDASDAENPVILSTPLAAFHGLFFWYRPAEYRRVFGTLSTRPSTARGAMPICFSATLRRVVVYARNSLFLPRVAGGHIALGDRFS